MRPKIGRRKGKVYRPAVENLDIQPGDPTPDEIAEACKQFIKTRNRKRKNA